LALTIGGSIIYYVNKATEKTHRPRKETL
jgi:hypothetical protein